MKIKGEFGVRVGLKTQVDLEVKVPGLEELITDMRALVRLKCATVHANLLMVMPELMEDQRKDIVALMGKED